jgi:Ni/Fe-hydrogenase subunit HybB-like protein
VSAEVYRANPRDLPAALVGLCAVLVAIGVVAFAFGLVSDPGTAWRAFHVNFLYFAGLSQGGLALACAMVIIGAKWAGPVRHVAVGLAAWVPVTFVLSIVAIAGGEHIFVHWWHGAPHPKENWLTPARVYAVDIGLFFVLALLSLAFIRAHFRPALHGAGERASRARGMFASWTRDWQGEAAEQEASERQLRVLAPILALLFAFGYGMIGFDQVMSLTPTWFSNIFAWYFAWGGFLCGVAATALICVLLRRSPDWQEQITGHRMHDLGKMVFAFSIFWMYLFFAQYIVIWYGNLPEETQFFQLRVGSQFLQDTWFWNWARLDEPYVKLSLAAWIGCWWVPFWVLLGQASKRTPMVLGTVAAVVLAGFWLERNALVWPSLVPDDGAAWFGPIQIGIALGFLGAFALVQLIFSRVFPTLPLPSQD